MEIKKENVQKAYDNGCEDVKKVLMDLFPDIVRVRSEVVTNLVAGVTDGVILIGGDYDGGVERWIMTIGTDSYGTLGVCQVNGDYKYKVSEGSLTATKIT